MELRSVPQPGLESGSVLRPRQRAASALSSAEDASCSCTQHPIQSAIHVQEDALCSCKTAPAQVQADCHAFRPQHTSLPRGEPEGRRV